MAHFEVDQERFTERLLRDYEFMTLPESARLHLLLIAMLATQLGNVIPLDPKWIRQQIGTRCIPDMDLLLSKGFLRIRDSSGRLILHSADPGGPLPPLSPQTPHSPLTPHAALLPEVVPEEEADPNLPLPVVLPPPSPPPEWRPGIKLAVAQERRRVVERIWQSHLDARIAYFRHKNGQLPTSTPTLTPKLRRLIWAAVERHGEEKAEASGRGIFLDPFCTGDNDRNREYLDPAICWRETPKDHVDSFAALVMEVRHG